MARKPKNPFPEIDFSAAGPPPGLEAQPPASTPRRRRQAPNSDRNPHHSIESNTSNIYNSDDDIKSMISLEDKLTEQELKFLEYSLDSTVTIENALKLAGYKNLSKNQIYRLAKKIEKKYERATLDGRNIMIDIGFGPRAVAQRLKHLALEARSEMVQLQATVHAAKATRLVHEPQESHQGVKIIINCPPPDPNAPPPPGPPSFTLEPERPRIPPPSRPLQITK
jgi:hypothetical protein